MVRDLEGNPGYIGWGRALAHPLVRIALPTDRAKEFRDLWTGRAELLAIAESVPRTLCHLDFNPRNLLADDNSTIAIDWAFTGVGAAGEDVSGLVIDPVAEFNLPSEQTPKLFDELTRAYAEGLADAGSAPDHQQVRRIVAAVAAAKYSWVVPAVLSAASTKRPTINGRPIAEAAPIWGRVGTFLLDLVKIALR